MVMAKSMLHDKGLLKEYLLNWNPTEAVWNQTLIETWSGRKPSVKHTESLWKHLLCSNSKRNGVQDWGSKWKCIFAGYNSKSKGYRLFNLKTNKSIISQDVVSDENAAWNWNEKKILKHAIYHHEEDANSTNDEKMVMIQNQQGVHYHLQVNVRVLRSQL